MMNYKHKSRCW